MVGTSAARSMELRGIMTKNKNNNETILQQSAKVNRLLQEHEQHQKNVKALQLLQQQEAHHAKNMHLINELRNAILMRYHNK